MGLYRDEGVVLRTSKLAEADRIVTILTQSHGKIRAVARGIRRTKSRFGARLEPFMRVDFLASTGRTFDSISQAESLSAYAEPICMQYDSYIAANVIVETADKLISDEHEPVARQYTLLRAALYALATRQHPASMIAFSYVLRALSFAGWTPLFTRCIVCGRAICNYISVPDGGMMCQTDKTLRAHYISGQAREILSCLAQGDWHNLMRYEGAYKQASVYHEVEEFVNQWAQYYLERPIKSLQLETAIQ